MDGTNKKRISLEEIYPVIKEKLDGGGTVELPITGTSMLPLLVAGRDTVDIISCNEAENGDIIFYRRDNGQFVLHRIVGKDSKGLVLCGDNQWVKEYGIEPRHIIAVVAAINRKGKKTAVTDGAYKLYSRLWRLILPFRRYLLVGSRKIKKLWS